MPLPTPFTAPPSPQTDILSLFFDKPITNYEESRIVFWDNDPNSKPLTYEAVRESFKKFGHALKHKVGVQPGDRIGVVSLNGVHYPVILFGIMCAGGQAVPINPQSLVQDVLKYIEISGIKVIIVDEQFYQTVKGVLPYHPELIVIVRGKVPIPTAKSHFAWTELLNGPELEWPRGPHVNESLALICLSSGTSGLPKAVMLTHQNVIAQTHKYHYAAHHERRMQDVNRRITVLGAFPSFHAAGLFGSIFDPLYNGFTSVILQQFSLPAYLDLLEKFRPDQIMVAPPIVLLLARHPLVEGRDFSYLEHIIVGAAPCGQDLANACVKRINPKIRLQQMWGMSELVCLGSAASFGGNFGIPASDQPGGDCGYPLPGMELKIVNMETNEEIVPATVVNLKDETQRGELLVKGDNVFAGYLGMSEAENAKFFTADGFYRTGDVAVAAKDGRLWIVDRIKELIKSSGFQVAPAEIEGILLSHPEIVDCAVVGVPDLQKEGTTENVRAYIVLKAEGALKTTDEETAKAAIEAWYEPQVLGYKRLRGGIRFVDQVPKSPAGKILRRLLRDKIAAESAVEQSKL